MLSIDTTFRLYKERMIYVLSQYSMTLCVNVCVYIYIELVLSAWHGMSLIFRQRRQPPGMDVSCKFIE
jgi:hypothetical protein